MQSEIAFADGNARSLRRKGQGKDQSPVSSVLSKKASWATNGEGDKGEGRAPLSPGFVFEDGVREPDLLEDGRLLLALGLGRGRVLVRVVEEGRLAVGFL